MYKNKTPAFSLIELLVVMMISGITISITFTCYNIIQGQFSKYKKESTAITQAVDLEKVLSIDFYRAKLVKRDVNSIHIDRDDYKVTYELFGKKILRIMPMRTDTFDIDIWYMESRFGSEVVESSDFIDEVLFVTGEGENRKVYHHNVWYSSEDYMLMSRKNKEEDYVWSRP